MADEAANRCGATRLACRKADESDETAVCLCRPSLGFVKSSAERAGNENSQALTRSRRRQFSSISTDRFSTTYRILALLRLCEICTSLRVQKTNPKLEPRAGFQNATASASDQIASRNLQRRRRATARVDCDQRTEDMSLAATLSPFLAKFSIRVEPRSRRRN